MKYPTLGELMESIEKGEIIKNTFNGETEFDIVSGSYFADLIKRASNVYISHLILGGSYKVNFEDKNKVMEYLKNILDIIERYDQPSNK